MTKLIRRVGPDEFLFLALLAVVATIVGYRFGFGNQVEQLPIVMRLLDSSYLTNDFYVESASKFGPRFYYAHIVAGLAWFAPLSVVLFGLTLLVNLALVAISHFATRRLLGGDKIAGFVAATLVIAVSSFALGMVTDIRFVDFQPGSLAIPFALAAFWAGLERRPILAGTLAAVASVPHPLYGVEAGAIALATALVSGSFTPSGGIDRSSVLRSIAWSLAGAIVLAASTVVLWVLPMIGATGERIPTSELFSILAELRAPHHYLPSHFPLRHYASFAAFGIAAALAWTAWRRAGSGSGQPDLAFFVAPVTIAIACIGGFVFVELWPSRLWVTAQPFRLLFLLKWQGFLLLGWLIARWIREGKLTYRWLGWMALAGSSGGAHAPVACLCLLADRFGTHPWRKGPPLPVTLIVAGVGVVTIGLLFELGSLDDSVLVALATLVALLLVRIPLQKLRYALPVILVTLVVLGVGFGLSIAPFATTGLAPVLSLDEISGDEADAARWVRENVDVDAVFVAPPDLGAFRLLARRALVVDWKAIPFEDLAMREWRDRIHFCYGEVESGGFAALDELRRRYHSVTDAKLTAIGVRYGAHFALLYRETPTSRPVLYTNASYRIVAL